jgi:GT2 family glycosyltransferase
MNYCFNAATPKDNDLVLLLNNDVIFNDTKSLKHMIQIMTHNPEVGVVGSRLLYNNTNKLQHAGVIFDSHMRMPSHFRLNEISDASAEKNREFQVVTGAVLLTTGENYKNICTTNASSNKGMDEKYHWAFDDVDLCLSIKYNLNKKIVYCGQTNIFHEESATLKKNPVNKLFMSHNANYLRDKWKGRYLADKELYYSNINQGLFQSK